MFVRNESIGGSSKWNYLDSFIAIYRDHTFSTLENLNSFTVY